MVFLKRSSSWLAALLAFLLWGCGSQEIRQKPGEAFAFEAHASVPASVSKLLVDTPICCSALSDLPYQRLPDKGELSVKLGQTSPAFNFDSGKSFFAAYRLADLPGSTMIEVASRRTAEPGSLGVLLPDMRHLVFAPVVLILDEQFKIRRTLKPGKALEDCRLDGQRDVYRLHVDVAEPPALAAYMVILTTREMLALETEACGVKRHGLSPIGDLSVRISSLPFPDGTARNRSSWKWFPNANGPREVGVFDGVFQEPGLLIQGDRALHFYEWKDGRYAESLNIPFGRLVSAKAVTYAGGDTRYLSIGIKGDSGGNPVHHTFLSWENRGEPTASAKTVADHLAQHILPDTLVERIGFSVADSQVSAEFLSAERGTAGRIGDAAMAGGVLTAMPCGLCQSGACTPDMLASCAALFSVGAVLGGVVGVGSELLSAASGKNAPALGSRERSARLAQAAKAWKFDPPALMKCVEQELGKKENLAWRDQGRKGLPSRMPSVSLPNPSGQEFSAHVQGQGFQQGAEAVIARITLKPDQALADAPVYLVMEGQLRWAAMSGKEQKPAPLSWRSAGRKLGDWTQPGVATTILQQGCHGLAAQIVEMGRKAWAQ